MTTNISLVSPATKTAMVDVDNMDNIRQSVERRLRWYGKKNFVVKTINRVNDTEIVAEIADLDCFEIFYETFEAELVPDTETARSDLPLAS